MTKKSGKPWKYLLIPHNSVLLSMSFDALMKSYIQTKINIGYSSPIEVQ
jgi:hypothetical protein